MKCIFCKKNTEKGKGKIFVRKSGQKLFFCSSKCEKNFLKLKRKPRETKWTEEYQNIKKEVKK